MNGFYLKGDSCETLYYSLGKVFHCASPENHEIIIHDNTEFMDIMNIVAVCCILCPRVKVLTFELMNNHFHFILCGDNDAVNEFLALFRERIVVYSRFAGRSLRADSLNFKVLPIDSLEYLRASIAYCNRNGFVVRDNETPFSYPWGANSCYFNSFHKKYYLSCRSRARVAALRNSTKWRLAGEDLKDLYCLDNYVSPYSYCDIESGEKIFRDTKQYFYFVSKNIEWNQKISSLIGESIAYTDEDLWMVCQKISKERFAGEKISLLPVNSKLELARELHFKYNAGVKQVKRLLKINSPEIDNMI